jgi:glycosyltransferase involved in cell wall biosynthesis
MSLTVSVCLGTLNGESYLQQLLESLGGQHRLPDELLVGDDASGDSTVAIVERFATRAPFPVTVLHNAEQAGVEANFENLVGRASGDIIFPCDQDDVWLPEKLSKMASVFEEHSAVTGLFCNSYLIDGSGRRLPGTLWSMTHSSPADRSSLEGGGGLVWLVTRPSVAGHTLAFRSSARELLLPFSRSCHYDMWISRLLAATGGLRAIEDTLVEYRLHGTNTLGLSASSRSAFSKDSWNAPHRWADEVVATHELIGRLHERAPGALRVADEAALGDRAAHLARRTQLPTSRLRRLGAVGSELFSGRYFRYSNGLRSAGRDLVA